TFTGNVDAVQGDMVLSADRLRVYYDGDEQNAAPGPAGTGSIRRIEAEGNVLMSSPRETAQGEAGVYDVAASQVTLDGAVVLTRGDNVIRGQRLEVDLASGRSRVFAAVPSTEGGAPPQRVRALFTPEKKSGAGPTGQPATTAEAGTK
ncbi:MAG TPA: LptA/OstA family protein, partial [Candidatus Limnocylindrales bacterium]